MLAELGFECLEQDITFLINQACPSTIGELEHFFDASLSNEERLARSAQLIKVCEITLLAQKGRLPWDALRRVVRHSLKYYQTHSHLSGPLFVSPVFLHGGGGQYCGLREDICYKSKGISARPRYKTWEWCHSVMHMGHGGPP